MSYLGPGMERKKVHKVDIAEMIEAIESQGFKAKKGSDSRIEVYQDFHTEQWTWKWVGSFYWDKTKHCWRFYALRPYVHTRSDLVRTVSELRLETDRIMEVEPLWDQFWAKRNSTNWKRYLGAVVSFYARIFGT